jgi:hypothetical protein
MSRRNARPSRRGNPQLSASARLFRSVLGLSAGYPVFTAGRCVEDPGNPGFVREFVDWNDPTHLLQQTTGGLQVALPTPHADFRGARCVSTSAHVYVSTRSVAYWGVCNGSSVATETVRVFTPLAATLGVYDVTTSAGNQGGYQNYVDTTLVASLNRIGGGSQDAVVPTSIGAAGVGTPTYVSLRYEAGAYEYRRKSTTVASGSYANPATVGNSQRPLTLFANDDAADFPASMRWVFWGLFPALSASQRGVVQQFIQAAYGIAP